MDGGRPRRLLMLASGGMVAVIVAVAAYVIPRVRADTFPQAEPAQATTAFWVSVLADLLVAIAFYSAAVMAEPARISRRALTATAGLMAMILGLALLDAGAAFTHHGPAMKGVAVALFACAALEFVVGVIAFTLARSRGEGERGSTDD